MPSLLDQLVCECFVLFRDLFALVLHRTSKNEELVCYHYKISPLDLMQRINGEKLDLNAHEEAILKQLKQDKNWIRDHGGSREDYSSKLIIIPKEDVILLPSSFSTFQSNLYSDDLLALSTNDLFDASTISCKTVEISSKKKAIELMMKKNLEKVKEYEFCCQEYEMLVLLYKVLCQSDDVILKKISSK